MSLSLPQKMVVAEVGPRDGLQSFAGWIDTDTKVAMIDRLSDLGLPVIEVSSFAHPKAVPHLRDAEEVFERIKRRPGTVYRALVPNARGAQRGTKVRVDEMLGLITISATYTRKNQNMTIDEAIAQNLESFRIAEARSIPFVMALGMAFWCAYEGLIPEDNVIAVVRRLHDGGVRRFYLAGSLGMEDPAHVNRLFSRLVELFPDSAFGFHIHNLAGMATANILAALDAGVAWLEGAICGIGGGIAMPTKLGSVGNFPTEDLVAMLDEMGIATGIDPEQAVLASHEIARLLRIEPKSHRANGATRKSVSELGAHNPDMRYS
ncbi:hydroxymethylglutaryl-CoA lyase [Bradyrhizobium sp. Arg237L]|uniref:hydroxymethylglutaryl-CoA lyase n=1 Tax=Bradyrhizobium sp. Arg237L TaxID=3003352 RepID=UPI00249F4920|nr:hydroxymethylglutaryl-CoA lyase [Bradyrhizobium sp. Arg237L]MDI4236233.1 hydroxymethylglutaryl-CoA lyase [Bradyrhizobium sp. Arg237L]